MFWEFLDDVGYTFLKFTTIALISLLLLAVALYLGFYIREQINFFNCIENYGVWLDSYQIGCTYPHG